MLVNPKISVIMAVYNTPEEYLDDAINSILNQTEKDFEFIIIDDYSNETTQQVLTKYIDPRIQIHRNKENYGLTKSLNVALSYAKGEFIARMDSDDIALANRFAVQLDWMNTHSDCGVCGSLVEMYGSKIRYWTRWNKDREVRRVRMLFYNSGIVHPTAFIRKSILDENQIKYSEEIKKAQDYALWSNLIQVTDIQLIPEVLLKYRVSDIQISHTSHGQQVECEFMTIKRQLKRYFLSNDEQEEICHFYRGESQNIPLLVATLKKIINTNKKDHYYDSNILNQQITVLYTQAAIKQLKRQKKSSMILNTFFFRVLIPTHFNAFINYMFSEKITA